MHRPARPPFTLLAPLALALAPMATACKTRDGSSSDVRADFIVQDDAARGSGIFAIDWTCAHQTMSGTDGRIKQDEYCEWNRAHRASAASGPLECIFRTSFDPRRSVYLPQRVATPEFEHTKFNALPDLVELVVDCQSPDSVCFLAPDGKAVANVPCDATRSSDPEVCRYVKSFIKQGQSVAPVQTEVVGSADLPEIPAAAVPPDAKNGIALAPRFKRMQMVQIGVVSTLPPGCGYDVDPVMKTLLRSRGMTDVQIDAEGRRERTFVRCLFPQGEEGPLGCDDVAKAINVGVQLRIGPLPEASGDAQ